jgi:hypothetical protein
MRTDRALFPFIKLCLFICRFRDCAPGDPTSVRIGGPCKWIRAPPDSALACDPRSSTEGFGFGGGEGGGNEERRKSEKKIGQNPI